MDSSKSTTVKKVNSPQQYEDIITDLLTQALVKGGITLDCGCFIEADCPKCTCGNTNPLITGGYI